MAGLTETATWVAEVYQIEQNDPVVGGVPNLAQGQGITNVPHQLLANRTVWLKAQVEALTTALASAGAPTGQLADFAMNDAPTGWLECDGSAVSRTDYADLFSAIGTVWGEGNGSTTFNLPDMRGEFRRGFDNGRGIDGGRAFGSHQDGAIEAHTHTVNYSTGTAEWNNNVGLVNAIGSGSSAAESEETGGSETRPRNFAVLVCIKA